MDINQSILSLWDAQIESLERVSPINDGLFKLAEVEQILLQIQSEFDIKRQRLQQLLNRTGRTKRVSAGNRYRRLMQTCCVDFE